MTQNGLHFGLLEEARQLLSDMIDALAPSCDGQRQKYIAGEINKAPSTVSNILSHKFDPSAVVFVALMLLDDRDAALELFAAKRGKGTHSLDTPERQLERWMEATQDEVGGGEAMARIRRKVYGRG